MCFGHYPRLEQAEKHFRTHSFFHHLLLSGHDIQPSSLPPDPSSHISNNIVLNRKRQNRRKSRNRRPKNYWTDPQNLKHELQLFWSEQLGLQQYSTDGNADKQQHNNRQGFTSLNNSMSVLIPNERILTFYHRHDLRAAISSHGGREMVARKLPGQVRIMAGRWSDAVSEAHEEVEQLIRMEPSFLNLTSDTHLLRTTATTASKITIKRERDIKQKQENTTMLASFTTTSANNKQKWSHTADRKPKGYWSLQRVIQELYEYVDGVKQEHGRPAGWMPRPNEITASGRDDLKQAMARMGGAKRICRLARMVPFQEWYYFEGQLDLMLCLRDYLDCQFSEIHDKKERYKNFPSVSDIRRNGYEYLHSLIQYYGGRKMVAARLSMEAPGVKSCFGGDHSLIVNFGPFDLEFAVRLLTFVRNDQLSKAPPLASPVILMPSPSKLLSPSTNVGRPLSCAPVSSPNVSVDLASNSTLAGNQGFCNVKETQEGLWLHTKILEYGGYENVARRLGLALNFKGGKGCV